MTDSFDHCFSHLKKDEESAAECIHCLRKHGEQVLFDREEHRLKLGREKYDARYAGEMKAISETLGIKSLEDYERMDRKYNLTMY